MASLLRSSHPSLFLYFIALLFMALSTLLPTTPNHHHHRKRKKHPQPPPSKPPSSWEQFKSLLTCRSTAPTQVHDPSSSTTTNTIDTMYGKLGSSCTSICTFKDVVHGNTRVVHRGDHDHDSSNSSSGHLGPEAGLLSSRSASRNARTGSGGSGGYHHSSSSSSSSSRGIQLRRLSGCYECHAISELRRYPAARTICACSECGEVFTRAESLEHHQALRHAVSELGPEDSGRNIVEIIFKSSWLKKDHQICKIERILKVHNTQRTISRFEDYRDTVKSRATLLHTSSTAVPTASRGKKNPRCAADGNELLRFHCTALSCALGDRGSTNLCCTSAPGAAPCGVCTVIRYGFSRVHHELGKGVKTTASSGRAHDCFSSATEPPPPPAELEGSVGGTMRAMLVCRVIAGRIRRAGAVAGDDATAEEEGAGYDSVAVEGGVYTNLEELFVSNPKSILPCFVVIYRALE